ncbi:MAG: A/G-specific adenine glycosylase, partial [Burkholderiaceae bacterium]|nr:A/G-specific adenine glycosylase [Burkholderiaceae bacterium]
MPRTIGSVIAPRLIEWQRRHGRHDLPWQDTRDAYRVWLSEVMLQQTQVGTVVPYYLRFVARFPDVAALAAADDGEVLSLWSGLGYYSRARNLHRCAREVVARHGGAFPDDPRCLAALPGIGRSTAAAIAVFAFGRRAAILDGNVRRVLCRHAGVRGFPGERAVENTLWRIAESELPQTGVEAYTQGLMDLGALLCTRTRPSCGACPIGADCRAYREGSVAELPTPRPRRRVPLRRCEMFVVRRGDEVLLERRPPSGIWGGLWSLPQSSPRDADADHGIARLAVRNGAADGGHVAAEDGGHAAE